MNDTHLDRYAQLLVHYCIDAQKNDVILINTTSAAEKLLPYLYHYILKAEAHAEFQIQFKGQQSEYYKTATDAQLSKLPLFEKEKIQKIDATLSISAPTETLRNIPSISEKKNHRIQAFSDISKLKMKASQENKLRWTLCNFPTPILAKSARMSLKNYTSFVETACFLTQKNPQKSWETLRENQQKYVELLNEVDQLHFINEKTDLKLSVKNRLWINSDGRRNMPSGEVFTSPIETSANGHIYFSYPSRQYEQLVKGVHLEFKNGVVVTYSAQSGQSVLDLVFKQKNSTKIGEIAIGTNPNIQDISYNTLFDEKIGGSIHLALGNSYPETGGKNQSPIHWDLITCMQTGKILADNKCIYENGKFLL